MLATAKALWRMDSSLQEALVSPNGLLAGETLESVHPVSGGCIHRAWRLSLRGGRTVFAKSGTPQAIDLFEVEADALEALHDHASPELLVVPRPLGFCQTDAHAVLLLPWLELGASNATALGRGLALLHQRSSLTPESHGFGWHRDGFIGAGPQPGGWRDRWGDAFTELRLLPQLKLGRSWGLKLEDCLPLLEALASHLNRLLVSPSLVHGDLWGGNAGGLSDGRGAIFDPAAWWAHHEVDLAMTHLFGGFSKDFYCAYNSVIPAEQGFEDRIEIYNFYHLLNHANLFGGGYINQSKACLRSLVRRLI
jgi:fructosamine-3-kinase